MRPVVSGRVGLMYASLATAALTIALAQALLIPSLPQIAARFDATPSGVTALVTVFYLAPAVTSSTVGRLGDMFGKKRVLVAQLGVFCIGGLICALGSSLPMLLAGRLVMGTALALFPLGASILRDEFSRDAATRGVVVLSAMTGTGAAVGLSFGGLVADHLGYTWVFWIPFIGGLVAMSAVWRFVPESPHAARGRTWAVRFSWRLESPCRSSRSAVCPTGAGSGGRPWRFPSRGSPSSCSSSRMSEGKTIRCSIWRRSGSVRWR